MECGLYVNGDWSPAALIASDDAVKRAWSIIRVNVSALKIHMSEDAHDAAMLFPGFITEPRGDISVKVENTYLLWS